MGWNPIFARFYLLQVQNPGFYPNSISTYNVIHHAWLLSVLWIIIFQTRKIGQKYIFVIFRHFCHFQFSNIFAFFETLTVCVFHPQDLTELYFSFGTEILKNWKNLQKLNKCSNGKFFLLDVCFCSWMDRGIAIDYNHHPFYRSKTLSTMHFERSHLGDHHRCDCPTRILCFFCGLHKYFESHRLRDCWLQFSKFFIFLNFIVIGNNDEYVWYLASNLSFRRKL